MEWSGDVYQCLSCDYHYLPEFGPLRCPKCQSKERERTGCIENGAKFIEGLLNGADSETLLGEFIGQSHCDYCDNHSTLMACDKMGENARHFCTVHYSMMNKKPE